MSIAMDTGCLECQFRRNLELVRGLSQDEAKNMEFMRRWMELSLSLPVTAPSPAVGPGLNQLLHEMNGLDLDRYAQEKETSNAFALSQMDRVRKETGAAEDPVYAGLQFAILGNYLDFSALQGKVSFDTLGQMLEGARDIQVDEQAYRHFRKDLDSAGTLLYLTDNAGEIGFDQIFAEELQKAYPGLQITFCVRGGIAANDATRADARAVGLTFPVIDNGNLVAGTVPELLGAEAKEAFESADLILSKGMGNVETLLGCGKNIYYAFLVKCQRFVEIMGAPMMTPMLVRERGETFLSDKPRADV